MTIKALMMRILVIKKPRHQIAAIKIAEFNRGVNRSRRDAESQENRRIQSQRNGKSLRLNRCGFQSQGSNRRINRSIIAAASEPDGMGLHQAWVWGGIPPENKRVVRPLMGVLGGLQTR